MKNIIYIFLLLSLSVSFSQDGTPDLSFGDNGVVKIELEPIFGDIFYRSQEIIQLQSGNYISYGGFRPNSGNSTPASRVFIKLLNDGSLDTSFGTNGILTISNGWGWGFFYDQILKRNDDKLLISTTDATVPEYRTFLRQYDENGNPDSSFGVNGEIEPFISKWFVRCEIDNSNKITAVTGKKVNEEPGLLFKRFLPNGEIDISFGDNGVANINFALDELWVWDFKLLDNGKMYVVSSVMNFNGEDLILITKHLPSGELDTSFSDNGILTSPILYDCYRRIRLEVFDNEDILISIQNLGGSGCGGNVLFKVKSNGNLDTNFGENGYIFSKIMEPLIQENNRILLLEHDYGDVELSPGGPFKIIRRYNGGDIDESFYYETDPFAYFNDSIFLMIDSNGKVLTAMERGGDGSDGIQYITRLNNNPLGITDFETKNLIVTPNPTSGQFTVQNARFSSENTEYKIADVSGKIIKKGVLENAEDTIDISFAEKGIYFLKIQNQTFKLIKN